MMAQKRYKIESRYQYRSAFVKGGIAWTQWFQLCLGTSYKTKEDAEEAIIQEQKKCDSIDKATRLIHEFRIVEV